MKLAKVFKCKYGFYLCFIGSEKLMSFMRYEHCLSWMSNKVILGHPVSKKSYVTESQARDYLKEI